MTIATNPAFGDEYTLTVTGQPVFPADKVQALASLAHPNKYDSFMWNIRVQSEGGKLAARSNPGVDPVYLFVYESDGGSGVRQSRYAVDMDGAGNSYISLGALVEDVTVHARVNMDYTRFAEGVYTNLRVCLSPVTRYQD